MESKIVEKKLPLDDAITLEAKQNWECDLRRGLITETNYPDVKHEYEEAAMIILCMEGAGYEPEYDDHYLVVVEDAKGS